jgi:hypothetical protein
MHGCCLGTDGLGSYSPGLGSFPWGYLGDATPTEDVASLDTAALGLPGGILDPAAPPITIGQVQDYIDTGTADPGIVSQLGTLVQAAGPAIQSILQQVQFGQLASNTPISQLPALRSAVLGQTTPGALSNLFTGATFGVSAPLLIGGAVLLFVLAKKRGK